MQNFNIGETVNYNFREAVVVNTLPDDYYVFRYTRGNEPLYGCAHERFLCKPIKLKSKHQVRRDAYKKLMDAAPKYGGFDPLDLPEYSPTKFFVNLVYSRERGAWLTQGFNAYQDNFVLPVFGAHTSAALFVADNRKYLEQFRTGVE